ncbi:MAG: class I SAM-dependent methyltransferase [Deltaproteobacteria bacterium]|nr:class I SAM-dependent methyltransferase [Deltaproteobacteria bacterium]
MGYYDVFSWFYDASVEQHYTEHRGLAAAALDLGPNSRVLDVPCGTGGCFAAILEGLGPDGTLVGADASKGMLAKAQKKADAAEWSVDLVHVDGAALSADQLGSVGGSVDRLLIFLGMSAFDDMDGTFESLWSLLEPGGLCVLVDVHTEELGFQGRMVNLTARADITRRFWEPLEKRAESFTKTEMPSAPAHGGTMTLVTGRKPA